MAATRDDLTCASRNGYFGVMSRGVGVSDATISAVVSAIVGIIGGGTAAAWLTGGLTIRQKKIARRQKRRARAYVEAIAWMELLMASYRAHEAGVPVAPAQPAGPASTGKASSPVTGATFPLAVPVDADVGLDSHYFLTLRAQVVTFGTHDMARAFDRWVNAFKEVQANGGNAALKLDPQLEKEPKKTREALKKMTCHAAIFPGDQDKIHPGTTNPKRRRDPGRPDTDPGCLTRAVECCASWELRRG
jgi:hypothetical protein